MLGPVKEDMDLELRAEGAEGAEGGQRPLSSLVPRALGAASTRPQNNSGSLAPPLAAVSCRGGDSYPRSPEERFASLASTLGLDARTGSSLRARCLEVGKQGSGYDHCTAQRWAAAVKGVLRGH
jgi:hypothetical protein